LFSFSCHEITKLDPAKMIFFTYFSPPPAEGYSNLLRLRQNGFQDGCIIFIIEKRTFVLVENIIFVYNIHALGSIYGTEKYYSSTMCRFAWTVIYMNFVFWYTFWKKCHYLTQQKLLVAKLGYFWTNSVHYWRLNLIHWFSTDLFVWSGWGLAVLQKCLSTTVPLSWSVYY